MLLVLFFFLYIMWLASDEGRKLHGLWVMMDDYMILSIIWFVNVNWPDEVYKTLRFQSLLNLDLEVFQSAQCQVPWAAYDVKLYMYVFLPPFFVLFIVAGAQTFLKWIKFKYAKEKYHHRSYVNWDKKTVTPMVSKRNFQMGMRWGVMTQAQAIACLFYVLQVQLVKQCLQALSCVEKNGMMVVKMAQNIECDGSSYQGLQTVALLGIIFYGFTVLFFYAYIVNFKTGANRERRHKDGRLSMWTRVGSIEIPSDLDGTPDYSNPALQEGHDSFVVSKIALGQEMDMDRLSGGIALQSFKSSTETNQNAMDDWLKGIGDGRSEAEIMKAETNGKLTWSMDFVVKKDEKFYQRQFSFLTDNYSEYDLVAKNSRGMDKYDANGKPVYVKRGAMRRFLSKNWKVLMMAHRLSLLVLAMPGAIWWMTAQQIIYTALFLYVKPLDRSYTNEHPWENNIILFLALSNVVIMLTGAIYRTKTGSSETNHLDAVGIFIIMLLVVKYTIYVYYVHAARRVLLESARNAGDKHMNLGHKIRGIARFHAQNCFRVLMCRKKPPPPDPVREQAEAQQQAAQHAQVTKKADADAASQQASKNVILSGGTAEEASKAAFTAFLDRGGQPADAAGAATTAAIAAGGSKADAARAVEAVCAEPGAFESEHDKRTAAQHAKQAVLAKPVTWAERVEGWRHGYAMLLAKRPFRMMLYVALACSCLLATLALPGIKHGMDPGFDNFVPDASKQDEDQVGETSYRRLEGLAAAPGVMDLGNSTLNENSEYSNDDFNGNIVDGVLSQAERRRNLQGFQPVNLYFYHPTNMLTVELLQDLDTTDKEIRSWPEIDSAVAPSLLDYYLMSVEPIDKFNIEFDRGSPATTLTKEGIEAVSRFLLRARISHYTDQCLCANLTTKSTMIPYKYYDGTKTALVKKLRAYAHAKQQHAAKSDGVLIGYTYGWLVAYDRGMTIIDDLYFAIGALTFVFFVVWWHLRSLWVTSMGMFHILMSFFMAYVLYKNVFQVEMMNLMNLLMIFVMVGVGADDIFVIADCWKETGHMKTTHKQVDPRTLSTLRMRIVMASAFPATFVTTFTTATAFASNYMSIISPIRDFAIYSTCVVCWNYIFCITLFPAVLVIDEMKWPKYCTLKGIMHMCHCDKLIAHCKQAVSNIEPHYKKAPKNKDHVSVLASPSKRWGAARAKQQGTEAEAEVEPSDGRDDEEEMEYNFYGETLGGFVVTHRYKILLFFLLLQFACIYQTTKLRPAAGAPQLFPDFHPITVGSTAIELQKESAGCTEEQVIVTITVAQDGEEMYWQIDDNGKRNGPYSAADGYPQDCPSVEVVLPESCSSSSPPCSKQGGRGGTYVLDQAHDNKPVYKKPPANTRAPEDPVSNPANYLYFLAQGSKGGKGGWYLGPNCCQDRASMETVAMYVKDFAETPYKIKYPKSIWYEYDSTITGSQCNTYQCSNVCSGNPQVCELKGAFVPVPDIGVRAVCTGTNPVKKTYLETLNAGEHTFQSIDTYEDSWGSSRWEISHNGKAVMSGGADYKRKTETPFSLTSQLIFKRDFYRKCLDHSVSDAFPKEADANGATPATEYPTAYVFDTELPENFDDSSTECMLGVWKSQEGSWFVKETGTYNFWIQRKALAENDLSSTSLFIDGEYVAGFFAGQQASTRASGSVIVAAGDHTIVIATAIQAATVAPTNAPTMTPTAGSASNSTRRLLSSSNSRILASNGSSNGSSIDDTVYYGALGVYTESNSGFRIDMQTPKNDAAYALDLQDQQLFLKVGGDVSSLLWQDFLYIVGPYGNSSDPILLEITVDQEYRDNYWRAGFVAGIFFVLTVYLIGIHLYDRPKPFIPDQMRVTDWKKCWNDNFDCTFLQRTLQVTELLLCKSCVLQSFALVAVTMLGGFVFAEISVSWVPDPHRMTVGGNPAVLVSCTVGSADCVSGRKIARQPSYLADKGALEETMAPTPKPTRIPTKAPSAAPTTTPTFLPTRAPTEAYPSIAFFLDSGVSSCVDDARIKSYFEIEEPSNPDWVELFADSPWTSAAKPTCLLMREGELHGSLGQGTILRQLRLPPVNDLSFSIVPSSATDLTTTASTSQSFVVSLPLDSPTSDEYSGDGCNSPKKDCARLELTARAGDGGEKQFRLSKVAYEYSAVQPSGGDAAYATVSDFFFVVVEDLDGGVDVPSSSPPALVVTEGGTEGTYDVKLDGQPSADVIIRTAFEDATASPRVRVTSGGVLTFTRSTWSVAQQVHIQATIDGVGQNLRTMYNLTHTVESSDVRYSSIAVPDVVIAVEDTDAGVVAVGPASVLEGQSMQYALRLFSQPQPGQSVEIQVGVEAADATEYSIAGPTTLTFSDSNWDVAQNVTVDAAADGLGEEYIESKLISHTVIAGDSRYFSSSSSPALTYVGLDLSGKYAVDILDGDFGIVVAPATSMRVKEGDSENIQVRLRSQPQPGKLVAVSLILDSAFVAYADLAPSAAVPRSFDSSNWNVNQTFFFTGGTTASNRAGGNWIESSEIKQSFSAATTDTRYATGVETGSGLTVGVLDQNQGIKLSVSSAVVNEGERMTYTVQLESQPEMTTVISLTSDGGADLEFSITTLTFTQTDWMTPQPIEVHVIQDETPEAAEEMALISHTATTGDTRYTDLAAQVFTLTMADVSDCVMELSSDNVTVIEGNKVTYQMRMRSQPSADVTVQLAGCDTGGVSPDRTDGGNRYRCAMADGTALNNIVFSKVDAATLWSEWHTVEVSAPNEDSDASFRFNEFNQDFAISHSWVPNPALICDLTAITDVTVHVRDDDAGVILSDSALTVKYDSTNQVTNYTLRLQSKPIADVQIDVSKFFSDEAPHAGTALDIGTDTGKHFTTTPSTLTFTDLNWEEPQLVNIQVQYDVSLAEGQEKWYVRHGCPATSAFTSADPRYDPSVGYTSCEAFPEMFLTISERAFGLVSSAGGALTLNEGSTQTYTLKLIDLPEGDVVVDIGVRNPEPGTDKVTVTPSTITLTTTNWMVAQTVTVEGLADSTGGAYEVSYVIDNNCSTSADVRYQEGVNEAIDVAVRDMDADVVLSSISSTIAEDQLTTYMVRLNSQPAGETTIMLCRDGSYDIDRTECPSVVDHDGDFTISPATLVFSTSDWNVDQTVTVSAVADALGENFEETMTVQHTVLGAYATRVGENPASPPARVFSLTVQDIDGAVTATSLVVLNETGSEEFTVVLTSQPSDNVIISMSFISTGTTGGINPTADGSADIGAVDVNLNTSATLTFTSTNWDQPQTGVLRGVQDYFGESYREDFTLQIASSSTDSRYNTGSTTSVAVHVQDVIPASVPAGRFGRRLTAGHANVRRRLADSSVRTSRKLTGSSSNATKIVEGESHTYSLQLFAQPSETTTFELSKGVCAETDCSDFEVGSEAEFTITSPDGNPITTLEFNTTHWNVGQQIVITAVADGIGEPNQESLAIQHVVIAGDPRLMYQPALYFYLEVIDADKGLVVKQREVTVVEGMSNTQDLQLRLFSQPTAGVQVTVTFPDSAAAADLSIAVPNLDFTASNWDQFQSMNVEGLVDGLGENYLETYALQFNFTSTDSRYVGGGGSSLQVRENTTSALLLPGVGVKVVVQDADASIVIDSSTVSTSPYVEGADPFTYKVKLFSQPNTDTVVTAEKEPGNEGDFSFIMGNSKTFTSSNWNTYQTFTVLTRTDGDGEALVETMSVLHSCTGDARYEALVPTDAAISFKVQDGDSGVMVRAATVDVLEGTAESVSVKLYSEPASPVTVDIAHGNPVDSWNTGGDATAEFELATTRLLFTASDWNTTKTFTVTGVEDSVGENLTETYGITFATSSDDARYIRSAGTSGVLRELGGTTAIAGPAPYVRVAVRDSDKGIITTPSTLMVDEGTTVSYTVKLFSQPSGATSVTIQVPEAEFANDVIIRDGIVPYRAVFTPANWAVPQVVTVKGRAEDGGETLTESMTITHAVTATTSVDTRYQALGVDASATVSLTVNDMDVGVEVSTDDLVVKEDSSATYTVKLISEPSGAVTITVQEHGGSSSEVTFGSPPAASIELEFGTSDWSVPQTVRVNGVRDDIADADYLLTVNHLGGSDADSRYNGSTVLSYLNTSSSSPVVMQVRIEDIDGAIKLSNTTAELVEGTTFSYTITLSAAPTTTTVMNLVATSADVELSQSVFTFTAGNWDAPHVVVATAVADLEGEHRHEIVNITHVCAIGDDRFVSQGALVLQLTVVDIDAGLEFDSCNRVSTASQCNVSVVEGSTETYRVRLSSEPTSDVAVAISLVGGTVSSPASDNAALSPTSVTFTPANWHDWQSVNAEGLDDALGETYNQTYGVTYTMSSLDSRYSGLLRTSAVTVVDTDASIVLSQSTVALDEGTIATYTVNLFSQPTVDTVVMLSTLDDYALDATISPPVLTFTSENWNVPQTVTVTAAQDGIGEMLVETSPIAHTVQAGGDFRYTALSETLALEISDKDAAVLVQTTTEVTEGQSESVEIKLYSQPSDGVTLTVSCDSGGDLVFTSPTSLTFNSANWNETQPVTVQGVADGAGEVLRKTFWFNFTGVSTDTRYSEAGAMQTRETAAGAPFHTVASPLSSPVVVVVDQDANITLSATTKVIALNNNWAPYTITLISQPDQDTVISVSCDSTDVTLNRYSLTFTSENWNTPQQVLIKATGVPTTVNVVHSCSTGDARFISVSTSMPSIELNIVDRPAVNSFSPATLTAEVGSTAVAFSGAGLSSAVNAQIRACFKELRADWEDDCRQCIGSVVSVFDGNADGTSAALSASTSVTLPAGVYGLCYKLTTEELDDDYVRLQRTEGDGEPFEILVLSADATSLRTRNHLLDSDNTVVVSGSTNLLSEPAPKFELGGWVFAVNGAVALSSFTGSTDVCSDASIRTGHGGSLLGTSLVADGDSFIATLVDGDIPVLGTAESAELTLCYRAPLWNSYRSVSGLQTLALPIATGFAGAPTDGTKYVNVGTSGDASVSVQGSYLSVGGSPKIGSLHLTRYADCSSAHLFDHNFSSTSLVCSGDTTCDLPLSGVPPGVYQLCFRSFAASTSFTAFSSSDHFYPATAANRLAAMSTDSLSVSPSMIAGSDSSQVQLSGGTFAVDDTIVITKHACDGLALTSFDPAALHTQYTLSAAIAGLFGFDVAVFDGSGLLHVCHLPSGGLVTTYSHVLNLTVFSLAGFCTGNASLSLDPVQPALGTRYLPTSVSLGLRGDEDLTGKELSVYLSSNLPCPDILTEASKYSTVTFPTLTYSATMPGLYRLCYRWTDLSGAALVAKSELTVYGSDVVASSFSVSATSSEIPAWEEPCFAGSTCSVEVSGGLISEGDSVVFVAEAGGGGGTGDRRRLLALTASAMCAELNSGISTGVEMVAVAATVELDSAGRLVALPTFDSDALSSTNSSASPSTASFTLCHRSSASISQQFAVTVPAVQLVVEQRAVLSVTALNASTLPGAAADSSISVRVSNDNAKGLIQVPTGCIEKTLADCTVTMVVEGRGLSDGDSLLLSSEPTCTTPPLLERRLLARLNFTSADAPDRRRYYTEAIDFGAILPPLVTGFTYLCHRFASASTSAVPSRVLVGNANATNAVLVGTAATGPGAFLLGPEYAAGAGSDRANSKAATVTFAFPPNLLVSDGGFVHDCSLTDVLSTCIAGTRALTSVSIPVPRVDASGCTAEAQLAVVDFQSLATTATISMVNSTVVTGLMTETPLTARTADEGYVVEARLMCTADAAACAYLNDADATSGNTVLMHDLSSTAFSLSVWYDKEFSSSASSIVTDPNKYTRFNFMVNRQGKGSPQVAGLQIAYRLCRPVDTPAMCGIARKVLVQDIEASSHDEVPQMLIDQAGLSGVLLLAEIPLAGKLSDPSSAASSVLLPGGELCYSDAGGASSEPVEVAPYCPSCFEGTCEADYICSCFAGFEGLNCEQAICAEECVHGFCTAGESTGTMCSCSDGWQGTRCNTARCTSIICGTGALCIAPEQCQCDTGMVAVNGTTGNMLNCTAASERQVFTNVQTLQLANPQKKNTTSSEAYGTWGAGTFKISVLYGDETHTTDELLYNASATEVQNALANLSNTNVQGVEKVDGSDVSVWRAIFTTNGAAGPADPVVTMLYNGVEGSAGCSSCVVFMPSGRRAWEYSISKTSIFAVVSLNITDETDSTDVAFTPSNNYSVAELPPLVNTGTGCMESPCSKCHGNCESDAQCGTGLKCFQRTGSETIPGCAGGVDVVGDVPGTDYCYVATEEPETILGNILKVLKKLTAQQWMYIVFGAICLYGAYRGFVQWKAMRLAANAEKRKRCLLMARLVAKRASMAAKSAARRAQQDADRVYSSKLGSSIGESLQAASPGAEKKVQAMHENPLKKVQAMPIQRENPQDDGMGIQTLPTAKPVADDGGEWRKATVTDSIRKGSNMESTKDGLDIDVGAEWSGIPAKPTHSITITEGPLGIGISESNDLEFTMQFDYFTGKGDVEMLQASGLEKHMVLVSMNGQSMEGTDYSTVKDGLKARPITLVFATRAEYGRHDSVVSTSGRPSVASTKVCEATITIVEGPLGIGISQSSDDNFTTQFDYFTGKGDAEMLQASGLQPHMLLHEMNGNDMDGVAYETVRDGLKPRPITLLFKEAAPTIDHVLGFGGAEAALAQSVTSLMGDDEPVKIGDVQLSLDIGDSKEEEEDEDERVHTYSNADANIVAEQPRRLTVDDAAAVRRLTEKLVDFYDKISPDFLEMDDGNFARNSAAHWVHNEEGLNDALREKYDYDLETIGDIDPLELELLEVDRAAKERKRLKDEARGPPPPPLFTKAWFLRYATCDAITKNVEYYMLMFESWFNTHKFTRVEILRIVAAFAWVVFLLLILFQIPVPTFDPGDAASSASSGTSKAAEGTGKVLGDYFGGADDDDKEQNLQLELIIGIFTSMVFSLSVAFICVLFVAGIRFAFLSVATIFGIICCVLASFQLKGWKLGAIESLGISILIGSAVDYCLHLGHAIKHADGRTIAHQVKEGLHELGASITYGAITTAGASWFLLFCQLLVFDVMGNIILFNTIWSLLVSSPKRTI
jgi:predicted RND superfamily exporter protein